MSVTSVSAVLPAGHLLCDQPPHRHSDGGAGGEGADGKYHLWDGSLHQEFRLQQGTASVSFVTEIL